jgi:predicted nucleic acid-binding protein
MTSKAFLSARKTRGSFACARGFGISRRDCKHNKQLEMKYYGRANVLVICEHCAVLVLRHGPECVEAERAAS